MTTIDFTSSALTTPRPRRIGIWRRIGRSWRKTVCVAGAPGVGAFLGVFLLLDALAMGALSAANDKMQSVVGAIASLPFAGGRVLKCRTGPPWETLTAVRDGHGAWTVAPLLTEAEYMAARATWAETPNDPFKAYVHLLRGYGTSGQGLWTPVVLRTSGRSVEVAPSPAGITPAEEAEIRAAAMKTVAVMSAPGSQCKWSQVFEPWEKYEIDAALSGGISVSHRVLPFGIVNECAVVAGIVLLFAGQPRRSRRWLARRDGRLPVAIIRCTECGYELRGLPSDEDGERLCPECGKGNAAFY